MAEKKPLPTLYTIGHSNIDREQFLSMLKAYDIKQVVDVRSLPGSRKFPHFNKEEMEQWLADEGIGYTHLTDLGGRRNKLETALDNSGWEHPAFRNYADYTTTESFDAGMQALLERAGTKKTAVMCAEHHPSRCHRTIISDNLVARGHEVAHILPAGKDGAKLEKHAPGSWGATPKVSRGRVNYPA
jgi:uncharacterized protein (DUF488 family)